MNDLGSVCEEKNFETLYDKYSKSLYSFLYFRCGDENRASDLVQDAYIQLWKNCKKIFFEKSKSYLYTVAHNQFLTEENHKKVVLNYKAKMHKTSANYESPEYLLEEKEYMVKLENAIARLTNAQREVFLLNRIDKKKYREIAEILNISVKAVEKRMHAGLLSLKEELGRKV